MTTIGKARSLAKKILASVEEQSKKSKVEVVTHQEHEFHVGRSGVTVTVFIPYDE